MVFFSLHTPFKKKVLFFVCKRLKIDQIGGFLFYWGPRWKFLPLAKSKARERQTRAQSVPRYCRLHLARWQPLCVLPSLLGAGCGRELGLFSAVAEWSLWGLKGEGGRTAAASLSPGQWASFTSVLHNIEEHRRVHATLCSSEGSSSRHELARSLSPQRWATTFSNGSSAHGSS